MFRLLRWGFKLLIVFILLAGAQWAYRQAAAAGLPLPTAPLPFLPPSPPAGTVHFRGVEQQRLAAGAWIPGTDVQIVSLGSDAASVSFAGEASPKRVGDALGYRGPWHGLPATEYALQGRLIRLTDADAFLVAYYALTIRDTEPVAAVFPPSANPVYTAWLSAAKDAPIPGTTLVFRGRRPEGGAARIDGQTGDAHGEFQVLDSVNWSGRLRDDLAVRYNLRVIFYTDSFIQLGGTVQLQRAA